MFAPTQFGALSLPAPAPAANESAGDPGLDVLLAFAKDVIVQQCGDVWASLAPGATSVVNVTKGHNPGDTVFVTSWAPGLFAWRTGGDIETIADDYDIETARLSLLWVFLPTTNEKQRLRSPVVNAIAKSLNAALKRGRHPAWVKSSDPDTLAASQGSFLWSWAGWWAFQKASWKLQEVVLEGDTKAVNYPALQWEITVQERVFPGLPTDPAKSLNTLDAGGDGAAVIFRMPL